MSKEIAFQLAQLFSLLLDFFCPHASLVSSSVASRDWDDLLHNACNHNYLPSFELILVMLCRWYQACITMFLASWILAICICKEFQWIFHITRLMNWFFFFSQGILRSENERLWRMSPQMWRGKIMKLHDKFLELMKYNMEQFLHDHRCICLCIMMSFCVQALEIDETTVKAWFRRGQAKRALKDWDAALVSHVFLIICRETWYNLPVAECRISSGPNPLYDSHTGPLHDWKRMEDMCHSNKFYATCNHTCSKKNLTKFCCW